MNTDAQYHELVRLWIFRILAAPRNLDCLFGRHGFRDDDVTKFLGLKRWEAYESEEDTEFHIRFDFSTLHMEAEKKASVTRMPDFIQNNFDQLARMIRINKEEQQVLEFLAVRQTDSIFSDTFGILDDVSHAAFNRIVARALQMDARKVEKILSPKSHLVKSGVVILKDNIRIGPRLPSIFSASVAGSLLSEAFDRDKLLSEIASAAPAPTLSYRDYPHLSEDLKLLRPYIRTCLHKRRKGVNIFIHGIPGTGKSELSRVIAREMRCALYEISSEDKDGDPITPRERLNALRLANSIIGKRSILVFDEAEDVFNDGSFFQPSTAQIRKAWMNRMLETNPIPTFWISNSARGIDSANIRRFDFVLELKTPPQKQRERTYRRICGSMVSSNTIQRLSQSETLAPAVVSRAAKVISVLGDQIVPDARDGALERLVGNTLRAQGDSKGIVHHQNAALPLVYSIDYLNCATDLKQVGDSLKKVRFCRLCLYGPPGTGKTSFAHWLAEFLEKPIHIKRASDILSPYIGMTEQNFAKVFAQARTEGAILLLDEVDTFLQDRRRAVRSWEVSQVNEMLTQMEAFEGIFIASTNLMDDLDQAALRRFDLKLYFDYLAAEQAIHLFKAQCRDLKLGSPKNADLERITGIGTLTPGDFANVVRQHNFRHFANSETFLDSVIEECYIKGVPAKGSLGFG